MKLLLLNFFLLLATCSNGIIEPLRIGGTYHGKIDSSRSILRNSGSIDVAFFITQEHIVYAFCKDKKGLINYIFSIDTGLVADQIRVGMTYGAIKQLIPDMNIKKEIGWGTYIDLPSGWRAAFGLPNEKINGTQLSDTSKVKWFFKR